MLSERRSTPKLWPSLLVLAIAGSMALLGILLGPGSQRISKSSQGEAVAGAGTRPAGSGSSPGKDSAVGVGPASNWSSMRILIPSIGIAAPVDPVGLNADKTLEVPSGVGHAGWWDGGSHPGTAGPMVVVGHVSTIGGPGVFARLKDLKRGDLVTITQATGAQVTYAVSGELEISKNDFPTALVYGPTRKPVMRLITCAGRIDPSSGHFTDDLVVFGDLVTHGSMRR